MKKELLLSNLAKICLACILVAMVAAAFLTYWKEETKSIAKEPSGEQIPAEETAFLQAVESLKLQASAAGSVSEYPERTQAITDIGEKLKELLISDSERLLTGGVFGGDEFSVDISDCPLRDGTIRRIAYTLKYNSNGDPVTERYFFFQYSGETTFFSDVERLYHNGETSEDKFQVFENADGCFVCLLSPSGYNYTTFDSTEKIMDYYVRIYIPGKNGFHVEQNVEIPLKIASERNFQLIQEGELIKGVVSGYQSEPILQECVFNSLKLTFELSGGNWEGEQVDSDIPGLLLGLSDTNGNIRTLFIRNEGGKIRADEYDGQIIFSRQNELFSIKNYTMYKDFYGDEFENEFDFRTGNLDVKKLLCAPLGTDLTDDFNKILSTVLDWSYYSIADIPLYIGEDYVCYIQKSFESGGGSYSGRCSEVRFDKLDSLNDFILDGLLSPNFKETTLADLIYGKKAEELYKEDISTYGGRLQPCVDFRQLALKRNLGKWSVMLPIKEEYYHPGNGSYSEIITAFAAYDNDVPNFLLTRGDAVKLGSWKYWDAKDTVKFPESEAFLIQNDYFIGICLGERDYGDYDLSIPVNFNEYIVSINFADNDTQKYWTDELRNAN